jgi:hypothetical protein
MAQRRPKAAILGSRIGPFQTRSLVDEPARRLPPDKCPDLPLQGSPETRAPFWCHPPSQCLCIAILLVFAGLHYWQSWPWTAFDDDAAASTSRKRNIALRGCPGAAVGLRPGCRKNGTT